MREIKERDAERRSWSSVDIFMVLYGLFTVLSYCFSDYKQTALLGYEDRYMGLVTQMLLVCGYFLVSRFFVGESFWGWLQRNSDWIGPWKRKASRGIVSIMLMTGLVILLYQMVEPVRQLFSGWKIIATDVELAEGSGVLWEASIRCFQQGDWKQKLLGAGPDCFGCIIYDSIDLIGQISIGAQNEWVNLLVTGGILGCISYVGILAGCLFEILRKRKLQPILGMGNVVIACYLLIGMFQAQQLITTTILFLVLGMVRGICRREETSKGTASDKRKEDENAAALTLAYFALLEEGVEDAEAQRKRFWGEERRTTGLKGRRMQRLAIVTTVMVAGAVLCLGYSAFLLADLFGSEARSEAKMAELRELGTTVSDVIADGEAALETSGQSSSENAGNTQDMGEYASVFAQNRDMAAWLKIEGTNIDYPVMQTPADENYYLYRDFYGKSDRAGCLILDTDSNLYGEGTTNQIIHGHNMKSGTMFGELDKYREEEYCKEHSRIQLFTKEEEREYEVIAVFYSRVYLTTDVAFKFYNFFQADTEEEFQYFYENIKELSLYDTGVEAEPGDRFLTLSTCSYHTEDGRFVVVAREVRKTEDALGKEA